MAIITKLQSLCTGLSVLGTLLLLLCFPCEGTHTYKHTTHLVHRDSPLSPFYDPSNTHFERLQSAFKRSLKRISHFNGETETQARMKPSGGEYLMKISIGTPPVEVIGIADTGSDLIWTQCLPCIQCYKQTIPLLDPKHSKSYQTLPCQSNFCNPKDLGIPQCKTSAACVYRYSYLDGSHTAGNIASETLTLGLKNPISLPKIVFGCAHDTAGIFDEAGSGIIGLGRGNLSLISQLGTHFPGGKKFSYCFVPTSKNSTSKISFGKDSVVSGSEVVTTPISTKDSSSYLLTLEALSVEKERIPFASKADTDKNTDPNAIEGNIVIDTGTTFTLLPSDVYNGLVSALRKIIKANEAKDPSGVLTLCYESIGDNIRFPIITAHFKGGDIQLQPVNTFARVKEDVVCFTMISNDTPIFGNLAQTNFLVGYDLEAGTVSFKPTDCSK